MRFNAQLLHPIMENLDQSHGDPYLHGNKINHPIIKDQVAILGS